MSSDAGKINAVATVSKAVGGAMGSVANMVGNKQAARKKGKIGSMHEGMLRDSVKQSFRPNEGMEGYKNTIGVGRPSSADPDQYRRWQYEMRRRQGEILGDLQARMMGTRSVAREQGALQADRVRGALGGAAASVQGRYNPAMQQMFRRQQADVTQNLALPTEQAAAAEKVAATHAYNQLYGQMRGLDTQMLGLETGGMQNDRQNLLADLAAKQALDAMAQQEKMQDIDLAQANRITALRGG